MNNQQKYYFPITENLIGGVSVVKDVNGNELVIATPTAQKNIQSEVPPMYCDVVDDIKNIIDGKVPAIGFTASKVLGKDELDNTVYYEETGSKELVCSNIKYSETVNIEFPYNSIIYHPKNTWKYNCLLLCFYNYHGIIPSSMHNLPSVINVKRSSGIIQKGIIPKKKGLSVRKSVSRNDDVPRIYVNVSFSNEDPDDITEEGCTYSKGIPLEELLTYNDISNVRIQLPSISNLDNEPIELEMEKGQEDYIKCEVEKHYTDKANEWKENVFLPCVKRINDEFENMIEVV